MANLNSVFRGSTFPQVSLSKLRTDENFLLVQTGRVISLDIRTPKGKCACKADMIPCNDCFDQLIDQSMVKSVVRKVLKDLPDDQYFIVCSYFGLYGFSEKSPKIMAKELNLTEDEVLQKKEQALISLRNSSVVLQNYLD